MERKTTNQQRRKYDAGFKIRGIKMDIRTKQRACKGKCRQLRPVE